MKSIPRYKVGDVVRIISKEQGGDCHNLYDTLGIITKVHPDNYYGGIYTLHIDGINLGTMAFAERELAEYLPELKTIKDKQTAKNILDI